MEIETTTIGINRYAPDGANDINMYNVGESGNLTIGQLAIAVSIRNAAAYEAQSVLKMNTSTTDSDLLSTAADWMAKVADGSATNQWAAVKDFLVNSLGVPASSLPDDISTYARRMQVVDAMKVKMESLVQKQQQDMIDLQSLVNHRDVAFSTSSNIVRTLGNSMSGEAANFR